MPNKPKRNAIGDKLEIRGEKLGFDDGEEGGCRLFFRTISVKNINRDRGGLHIPQH